MSSEKSSPLKTEDIAGISFAMEGVEFHILCVSCRGAFASIQKTMGGVPLSEHVCPKCAHRHSVTPESFIPLMNYFFIPTTVSSAASRNAEVERLASTWHQIEPWRSALLHDNINLGPATEREIASHFNCAHSTRAKKGQ